VSLFLVFAFNIVCIAS